MEKRPAPKMDFSSTDLGHGIYKIAGPMNFQQYLVLGSEKALLIDTGFGCGSLKAEVEKLTKLPLVLVNTHGHPDHGGGNSEFGAPLLHPADNELYAYKCAYEVRLEEALHWPVENVAEKLQPTPPAPTALEDGAVIDLGGRQLRVIHTPGHTRGSICLFDEESRYLFTGDNVQQHATNLCEPWAATVEAYAESMKRIAALPAVLLCGGHMPGTLPVEYIAWKIECAEKILKGEQGEYVTAPPPRGSGWVVTAGDTAVQYDIKRIR